MTTFEQFEPLVRRVKELLRGYRESTEAGTHLWNNGFSWLGSGDRKSVFHHRDFPGFVVKTFWRPGAWVTDYPSLGIIVPELIPFFLPHLWQCPRFIIQERCDDIGGTPQEARDQIVEAVRPRWLERFPHKGDELPWDIHSKNTFFHRGKPVLVDYSVRAAKRLPKVRKMSLVFTDAE